MNRFERDAQQHYCQCSQYPSKYRKYWLRASAFLVISVCLLLYAQYLRAHFQNVGTYGTKETSDRAETPVIARPLEGVTRATLEDSPWRIGFVGNIALFSAFQPLVGVAAFPENFLSPLQSVPSRGIGGGVEFDYTAAPWLSFAVRGEYSWMQARGESRAILPAGSTRPPDMLQGQPAPRLIERRTALDYESQSIAFTPFARIRFWDIFTLNLGARVDAILRMPLSYTVEIDSLQGSFVAGSSFPRRVLYTTQNFPGRAAVSFSPVVGVGATLNLGKHLALVPEVQFQTQYRPFAETSFGMIALRANLSLLFRLPARQIPDDSAPLQRLQPLSLPDTGRTLSAAISSSDTSSSGASSSDASRLAAARLDTVVRQDTVVRLVSWQEQGSVRRLGRTVLLRNDTVFVEERYERSVPKSKPFLVADLNVRFIPSPGAPRQTESVQTTRLSTHQMIVRRFVADNPSPPGIPHDELRIVETLDTIDAVRMPVLRFIPEISGELGIESSVVEIFSPDGAILERFAVESRRVLDWNMQHLFLSSEKAALAEALSSGKPLKSLLIATDTEGQVRRSDTLQILIEASGNGEWASPSIPSPRTPNSAVIASQPHQPAPRIASRSSWLMVTLPVPPSDEPLSHNEALMQAFMKRLPRSKPSACTIYVNASSNEASAVQYAQIVATQLRALRSVSVRVVRRAQALPTLATLELVLAIE